MFDAFKDIFIDSFNDDKVIFFISWFLLLISFLIIIMGSTYIVDSTGKKILTGYGTIIDKKYTPTMTTTNFIFTGKIWIPTSSIIPEHHDLYIAIGDRSGSIQVYRSYFDSVKINDTVKVLYSEGRISDNIYIKEIIEKVIEE